jgi:hypothetical protein
LLKASSGLFLGRKLETRMIAKERTEIEQMQKGEKAKAKQERRHVRQGEGAVFLFLKKELELATVTRQGSGKNQPGRLIIR